MPWRLSTPTSFSDCVDLRVPGAQHLVIYHFVVDGAARQRLERRAHVELSPGDIVVFPAPGIPTILQRRAALGANQTVLRAP